VQSPDLTVNVYPFILRGVSLCGVNSQADEMPNRKALWNLLAGAWKPASLEAISPSEVSLDGLSEKIDLILKGGVRGRVLVNLVQP
jgi:NADPH:quinone reductase-like Zn-dependent oxidoreductase